MKNGSCFKRKGINGKRTPQEGEVSVPTLKEIPRRKESKEDVSSSVLHYAKT